MADYWKSQARKHCDFCKCWIADNKPSIEFHENGRKHKENVSKRIKEIYKNSAKQAKQQKKFENDFQQMEKAAMTAYLKDVESNTRDLTADKIIHEKRNKKEENKQEKPVDPNRIPYAAPETNPRFKESTYISNYGAADIDPLDPFAKQKLARLEAREAKAKKEASKSSGSHGKSKSEKDKGKGKKQQDEKSKNKILIPKVWHAVKSHGYSYYWNTVSNETSWEPPAEGFLSLSEQAEEAKEQALQAEFLKEIEKEEEKEKAEVQEEQRANAEREKLKEIRKRFLDNKKTENNAHDTEEAANDSEEEKIPYRRDYSVPEKPQPYGSWQVVKKIEKRKIDLQLPKVKEPVEPVINYDEPPPPLQKVFKEKTITHISAGDSDGEGSSVSFKKRKFGNKNVRKRIDED